MASGRTRSRKAATTGTRRSTGNSAQAWAHIPTQPVVVLDSAEPILADLAVERLVTQATHDHPGASVHRVDADQLAPGALMTIVGPSLFAEPRIVIVTKGENITDAGIDEGIAYLGAPEPDVVVVFVHSTKSQRGKKLWDAAARAGFARVALPSLAKVSAKEDFIRYLVSESGKRISAAAVHALIDAQGSDIQELYGAVRQLIADIGGDIDVADVDRYYGGRSVVGSFAIADAALSGRIGDAIAHTRSAMATGTKALAIVGACTAKVRQMLQVRAQDQRPDFSLSLPAWQARDARSRLSGLSESGLAKIVEALAAAEDALKDSSADDAYIVEHLLMVMASARRYVR
ncbi:MAG: DNA polymerase III subunit delta [Actinomycetaceae bacterium]|nr:DNA polymerase III subunit delta [Actinomycetaceae bacterium]MDY6083118.1 DNA polymerase III subunit delta [Actinomycetaceae bacterium]